MRPILQEIAHLRSRITCLQNKPDSCQPNIQNITSPIRTLYSESEFEDKEIEEN